jgi:hypothetical protein
MGGNQFKKWNDITRKMFIHSRTALSERSDLKTDTNYKPGGTISTIIGKCKLASQNTAVTHPDSADGAI